MLSMPPFRFAAATSSLGGRVGILPCGEDQLGDLGVADDVGEPVGADQIEVARRGLDRERLDLDARLRSDCARDHRAVRMLLRLLGRELPGADELAHERVVGGQLLEHVVPQQVGAGVADMADRDRPRRLVDEQRSHDRPHARGGGILERVPVDAVVRLAKESGERLLAEGVRGTLLERGRGETGRDLARLGAADTVRDREERRVADERVFVLRPAPAGVGERARSAGPHASTVFMLPP